MSVTVIVTGWKQVTVQSISIVAEVVKKLTFLFFKR